MTERLDFRGWSVIFMAAVIAVAVMMPSSRRPMLRLVGLGEMLGPVHTGTQHPRPAGQPPGTQAGTVRPALSMPKDLRRAVRAAQAVRIRYRVPVSVTLGQAMHESRPGLDSGLAKRGKNYFGVKCGRSPYTAGCINMDTVDYTPGSGLYLNPGAAFRRYNSPEASFLDYGLVLQLGRYAAAYRCGGDPACFLRAVEAGGYASPGYAARVLQVIRAQHLTRWDK